MTERMEVLESTPEAAEVLDSMFGMHVRAHPPVTRECRAADIAHDKMACALCQTYMTYAVWDDPGNLQIPEFLADIKEVFFELLEDVFLDVIKETFFGLLEQEFSQFTCPFPQMEVVGCRTLRATAQPPYGRPLAIRKQSETVHVKPR